MCTLERREKKPDDFLEEPSNKFTTEQLYFETEAETFTEDTFWGATTYVQSKHRNNIIFLCVFWVKYPEQKGTFLVHALKDRETGQFRFAVFIFKL